MAKKAMIEREKKRAQPGGKICRKAGCAKRNRE